MSRLIAGAALLLIAGGCSRTDEPAPQNVVDAPEPAARPTRPPDDAAPVAVGRDDVALARSLIPELDGVATLAGAWTGSADRARFVAADGTALAVACDRARPSVRIAYRPSGAAPLADERTLRLLTERGVNLFTLDPTEAGAAVVTARFTARLPFFQDALAAGEGVIGVELGARPPVAIPNDEALRGVLNDCG